MNRPTTTVGNGAGVTATPWRRMRLTLAVAIASVSMLGSGNSRTPVLIVMTSDAAPYAKAEKAMRASLGESFAIETVLIDAVSDEQLQLLVKERGYAAAIGTRAAKILSTRLPGEVPSVFSMVSEPERGGVTFKSRATGVSVDVPIAAQLEIIAEAMPDVRRIGMLYRKSSRKSVWWRQAMKEALPQGWELLSADLGENGSIAQAIDELLDTRPDIIWTIADSSVYNAASVRTLLKASLQKGVPVFGFSTAFVRSGALLGVGIDPSDQGRQAADIIKRWKSAPAPGIPQSVGGEVPKYEEPDYEIAINLMVAERLGVRISTRTLNQAGKVFRSSR